MSVVLPRQEIGIEEINQIRSNLTAELLRRAQSEKGFSNGDLVVREILVGDESDATDGVDLDLKTAATTGIQEWMIDQGDLTAGDLSSIFASGEKVNDNTWIGFYGFFDLTGGKQFVAWQFKKGSQVLDFWNIESCYAYNDIVMGFTRQPVIYGPENNIDVKLLLRAGITSVTGEDFPIGLRAVVVEHKGNSKLM